MKELKIVQINLQNCHAKKKKGKHEKGWEIWKIERKGFSSQRKFLLSLKSVNGISKGKKRMAWWTDERIIHLKFKWKEIHIKKSHKETVQSHRQRKDLISSQRWSRVWCAD